jgi:hypothetical protein
MLAIEPRAPRVALQAPEVGTVASAWLGRRKAPKHVLAHNALAVLLDDNWRRTVRIDVQGLVQVQLDQSPWSTAALGPGERYRCPRCDGQVDWHIHGPTWRPIYDEVGG